MLIGIISDTHGLLHPQVLEHFEGVDLILHAGDVGGESILTDLAALAPVLAVTGNVDWMSEAILPLKREMEHEGVRIGMTHGHLPEAPTGALSRMREFFTPFDPAIIIYGHSHIARHELVGGTVFFNPGSAGPPRFKARPSLGLLKLASGMPPQLELRDLVWPIPRG